VDRGRRVILIRTQPARLAIAALVRLGLERQERLIDEFRALILGR